MHVHVIADIIARDQQRNKKHEQREKWEDHKKVSGFPFLIVPDPHKGQRDDEQSRVDVDAEKQTVLDAVVTSGRVGGLAEGEELVEPKDTPEKDCRMDD